MNITELHNATKDRKYPKAKRVGRGRSSGHGKTSGRGMKGQKSRSGKLGRPHFEGGQTPLVMRVPKRGFNNKWKKDYAIVNLWQLESKFQDGDTVDPAVLLERGIIEKSDDGLKVLGEGELTKKLRVKAQKFSGSAKEKIEKAGGEAEAIG